MKKTHTTRYQLVLYDQSLVEKYVCHRKIVTQFAEKNKKFVDE